MTSFLAVFLPPDSCPEKNRRVPIGSYRFQKGPAGDRLENYRNCPKTSDRNPAAKNQSKTARKRSEAAKTGGIRHGNRRNRPAFRGSGNWIDRPGKLFLKSINARERCPIQMYMVPDPRTTSIYFLQRRPFEHSAQVLNSSKRHLLPTVAHRIPKQDGRLEQSHLLLWKTPL